MRLKRRVPYVSQLGNMDCGVACLTMLFNYHGLKLDIVDIGMDMQVGRDGVSLVTLKKIAEKYGFKFAAYKYGYNQDNLDRNLPAILLNGSHYVIVERKKKKINILSLIRQEEKVLQNLVILKSCTQIY